MNFKLTEETLAKAAGILNAGGVASTVVKVAPDGTITVIREGGVSVEAKGGMS